MTEPSICGQVHPEMEDLACARKRCVEYHRSESGVIWTQGAAPMPPQSTDPVRMAALVTRTREHMRARRGGKP